MLFRSKTAVERIMKYRKEKIKEIQVGFIAINKFGEYGGYCVHSGFQFAVQDSSGVQLVDAPFIVK